MKKVNVACGVIFKDGHFLICQKGKDENFGLWEFPGGKLKNGESLMDCISREINEELGLDIVAFSQIISYDIGNYILHFIRCSLKETNQEIQLTEHIDFRWITKSEVGNYCFIDGDKKFVEYIRQFEK
jgi:8-oxo-dGTP diphosphatase